MQDRFKFRQWNEQTKTMLYNIEQTDDVCLMEYLVYGNVMQCTGLKDKNGKLIYEGDIVDKGTRCKWIITWFKNRFILVPDFEYKNKDKCASDRDCGFKYFENNHNYADKNDEVIGNIYENPELLED